MSVERISTVKKNTLWPPTFSSVVQTHFAYILVCSRMTTFRSLCPFSHWFQFPPELFVTTKSSVPPNLGTISNLYWRCYSLNIWIGMTDCDPFQITGIQHAHMYLYCSRVLQDTEWNQPWRWIQAGRNLSVCWWHKLVLMRVWITHAHRSQTWCIWGSTSLALPVAGPEGHTELMSRCMCSECKSNLDQHQVRDDFLPTFNVNDWETACFSG